MKPNWDELFRKMEALANSTATNRAAISYAESKTMAAAIKLLMEKVRKLEDEADDKS